MDKGIVNCIGFVLNLENVEGFIINVDEKDDDESDDFKMRVMLFFDIE